MAVRRWRQRLEVTRRQWEGGDPARRGRQGEGRPRGLVGNSWPTTGPRAQAALWAHVQRGRLMAYHKRAASISGQKRRRIAFLLIRCCIQVWSEI